MFAQLVLARIIEPVSKLDSLPVLEEAGIAEHVALVRYGWWWPLPPAGTDPFSGTDNPSPAAIG